MVKESQKQKSPFYLESADFQIKRRSPVFITTLPLYEFRISAIGSEAGLFHIRTEEYDSSRPYQNKRFQLLSYKPAS